MVPHPFARSNHKHYTLPSLQFTTFDGGINDMMLFTVTPNLTEAKCSVDFLSVFGTPASPILHSRLQFLALVYNFDDPEDILQYLTLPALQCLRISEMHDTSYSSLHSFLTRSSPALISLSIRGDNHGFSDWQECFSAVGGTLGNLELDQPSERVQDSIFYLHHPIPELRFEHSRISPPFPKLKDISFLNVDSTHYGLLASFLKNRSSGGEIAKLQSFRLVWKLYTYLDSIFLAEPENDRITRNQ
ncbi:hypothetical protein B0H19DRAFT_1078714 [Mycena capillaripes]|nr:hypothetical protein B0H19DRAFT_1078714 [Mycena capillaripes]